MMEKLLIVLLLSALTEPGESLSCVSCMDTASLKCVGELESCPPHHKCSSSFKVTHLRSGKTLNLNIRSCIPENQCSLYGTLTVPDGNIIIGTSCCGRDGCTPSIMARKPVKAKPNGVRCKYCTGSETAFCETNETIECTGNEDQCINYSLLLSTRFEEHAYAFRGCGTKSLCEIDSFASAVYGVDVENRFICTEAEPDPSNEENSDTKSTNESTSPPPRRIAHP